MRVAHHVNKSSPTGPALQLDGGSAISDFNSFSILRRVIISIHKQKFLIYLANGIISEGKPPNYFLRFLIVSRSHFNPPISVLLFILSISASFGEGPLCATFTECSSITEGNCLTGVTSFTGN